MTTTTIPFEDLTNQRAKPAGKRAKPPITGAATTAQAPLQWRKIAFAVACAVLPITAGVIAGRRGKLAAALAGGGTALALAAFRNQLQRLFTDEPAFTTESRVGALELRAYPARVEAQTQIDAGSWDEALDQGFHRLAGYIFGGNRTHEELAMTAPVSTRGEKLAMTSPVIASDHEGSYTTSFIMPPGRTLASLPKPLDKHVHLREVPARRVAVLRFTGRYSARGVGAAERELLRLVTAAGLEPTGKPAFAGFDPPTTLPFLRRNEVWIEVAPAQAAAATEPTTEPAQT